MFSQYMFCWMLVGLSWANVRSQDVDIAQKFVISPANSNQGALLRTDDDRLGASVNPPLPFEFSFASNDGQGTDQYRQESSAGDGVVRGEYGYKDPFGIYRHVQYVADANGFRPIIRSNEPGMVSGESADASFVVLPPPAEVLALYARNLNNPVLEDKPQK